MRLKSIVPAMLTMSGSGYSYGPWHPYNHRNNTMFSLHDRYARFAMIHSNITYYSKLNFAFAFEILLGSFEYQMTGSLLVSYSPCNPEVRSDSLSDLEACTTVSRTKTCTFCLTIYGPAIVTGPTIGFKWAVSFVVSVKMGLKIDNISMHLCLKFVQTGKAFI